MFSEHLQPVHPSPFKGGLIVAGALVIACQLIGMFLVVDSQVEKAQSRQSNYTNFQAAVASCVENSYGAALKKCADLTSLPVASPGPIASPSFIDAGLQR